MSEANKAKKESVDNNRNRVMKRVGIYGTVLLGVFLLGFVPMWLIARERANERDVAQAGLRLSQMQNRLASASIDARRGEYEPARIAASDFFTALRAEIDRGQDGALSQQHREALQPFLAQRDELITLLARNDPAAAARLADLYIVYRKAVDPAPRL